MSQAVTSPLSHRCQFYAHRVVNRKPDPGVPTESYSGTKYPRPPRPGGDTSSSANLHHATRRHLFLIEPGIINTPCPQCRKTGCKNAS